MELLLDPAWLFMDSKVALQEKEVLDKENKKSRNQMSQWLTQYTATLKTWIFMAVNRVVKPVVNQLQERRKLSHQRNPTILRRLAVVAVVANRVAYRRKKKKILVLNHIK